MKKILIIEDEPIVLEELTKLLQNHNYEVTGFLTFKEGMNKDFTSYDLILLDVNLNGENGFDIAKNIREKSKVPIIFVTGRNTYQDEVQSILVGGDDYIIKPYEPKVLILKMERILARTNPSTYQVLKVKDVSLDIPKSTLGYLGKQVLLTRNELQILYYLFLHHDEIVLKDDLIEYLWNSKFYIDENALNVNITRLRKKLEEIELFDFLITIPKKGYQI